MKAQKRLLSKQLRNAERVRSRLKKKARQLTNEDLVQVLMLRREKLGRMDASTASAISAADPPTTNPVPPTPPESHAVHANHGTAAAENAEEHDAID